MSWSGLNRAMVGPVPVKWPVSKHQWGQFSTKANPNLMSLSFPQRVVLECWQRVKQSKNCSGLVSNSSSHFSAIAFPKRSMVFPQKKDSLKWSVLGFLEGGKEWSLFGGLFEASHWKVPFSICLLFNGVCQLFKDGICIRGNSATGRPHRLCYCLNKVRSITVW